MLDKAFFIAGKAIFTVEVPASFQVEFDTKPHYTYRIKVKKGNAQYPNDAIFVQLLTGPENTRDYTYLGMLNAETGDVRLTGASKFSDSSWPVRIIWRVMGRIWANDGQSIEANGWKVHHEGKCARCCRTLSVPLSIERGIGPECWGKVA